MIIKNLIANLTFSLYPIANYPVLSITHKDSHTFIEAFFHIFSEKEIYSFVMCYPQKEYETPIKNAVLDFIQQHFSTISQHFIQRQPMQYTISFTSAES